MKRIVKGVKSVEKTDTDDAEKRRTGDEETEVKMRKKNGKRRKNTKLER